MARCSASATIAFGVLLSKVEAEIHDHVYIGPGSMLGLVTLERDVLVGTTVQIPSGPHTHGIERLDVPLRDQDGQPVRVTIGRDCWIGSGSIVMADVGEQTVVGAGSIVTRPLPARVIAAGNPAKVLRQRPEGTAAVSE